MKDIVQKCTHIYTNKKEFYKQTKQDITIRAYILNKFLLINCNLIDKLNKHDADLCINNIVEDFSHINPWLSNLDLLHIHIHFKDKSPRS